MTTATLTTGQVHQPSKGESLQCAKTIVEQLGGNKFVSMTGAKNLVAGDMALTFRLPSQFAKDGINLVNIALTGSDEYNVTFSKVRGTKITVVSERRGLHAADLQPAFIDATGLRTSL